MIHLSRGAQRLREPLYLPALQIRREHVNGLAHEGPSVEERVVGAAHQRGRERAVRRRPIPVQSPIVAPVRLEMTGTSLDQAQSQPTDERHRRTAPTNRKPMIDVVIAARRIWLPEAEIIDRAWSNGRAASSRTECVLEEYHPDSDHDDAGDDDREDLGPWGSAGSIEREGHGPRWPPRRLPERGAPTFQGW